MAGTSGCIPDYHVNFFGQLCGPARRCHPSTTKSPEPEPEPQVDSENQTNTAPELPRTPENLPAPRHWDPDAELFQKNQDLIRSQSCENIETHQATLRAVFKEVRENRRNARAERREVGDEDGGVQIPDGYQPQNEQKADEEAELKHQHKEQGQDQHQPESHHAEHPTIHTETQDQNQPEPKPQTQFQGALKVPMQMHLFIIAHYLQHKDQTELDSQSRGQ